MLPWSPMLVNNFVDDHLFDPFEQLALNQPIPSESFFINQARISFAL